MTRYHEPIRLFQLAVLLHAARLSFFRPARQQACSDKRWDIIRRGQGSLADEAALLCVLATNRIRDVRRQANGHAEQFEQTEVGLRIVCNKPYSIVLGTSFAAEFLVYA